MINLLAIHHDRSKSLNLYRFAALVAVFYCLWAMVGGDERTTRNAFVALLLSVPHPATTSASAVNEPARATYSRCFAIAHSDPYCVNWQCSRSY